jgi:hypothetical protein
MRLQSIWSKPHAFVFFAGVSLGAGTHASAAFTRQSASFCTADRAGGTPRQSGDGSVFNADSGSNALLSCPFTSDDALPHNLVTVLNIHGSDQVTDAQAGAQACVTFIGSLGSACGNQAGSGAAFRGDFLLQPDLSQWRAFPSDLPYLLIVLPKGNGQLRGWFAST